MTGRTITQIIQRTKVEIIVVGKEDARGMIFIKDVPDAYETATKQRGEAVLSHK